MNYPARGEMSEDGKYYTHTDGSVHARVAIGMRSCTRCSFTDDETKELVPCRLCGQDIWIALSEQTYVLTDEEHEACDMAREMIKNCVNRVPNFPYCYACMSFPSCPARSYLDAKHQPDAWEVKP